MEGPNKQLIETWDAAWAKKDAQAMKDVFASDVVLHADGMMVPKDRKGMDNVVSNFQKYFEMYDFDHSCLATAVNKEGTSVFGMWQDSDKKGQDSVAGIWKVKIANKKIQEIFFLRQMHQAEKEHKLKDVSSIRTGGVEFQYGLSKTPNMSAAPPDFADIMRNAAAKFSDVWQQSNPALADEVCKPDMKNVDLLKGGEIASRDEFENMLKEVFKHWGAETHEIDIGVSPGDNKAFVHWVSTGHSKDTNEKMTTYGLNLLEFDPSDGKIMRSAGFRQLMPNEIKDMMKTEAMPHAAEV